MLNSKREEGLASIHEMSTMSSCSSCFAICILEALRWKKIFYKNTFWSDADNGNWLQAMFAYASDHLFYFRKKIFVRFIFAASIFLSYFAEQ